MTQSGVITKYYYFGGKRVALRTSAGVTYLHGDHLGSTSVASTASGALVSRQTYYAFGAQRSTEGSALPTDYTFTGQKLDADAGLMYYGARYYDWVLGRFISADTIVPDSASARLSPLTINFSNPVFIEELGREHRWSTQPLMSNGSIIRNDAPRGLSIVQSFHELSNRSVSQASGPLDPQNLNRYAYVRNNPLRYVDPSGYWTFGFGLGGTIGAGGGISGSVPVTGESLIHSC